VAKRRYLSNLSEEFQDTTGSGTGDLRRHLRLDYLQKLRVDAIWLTPFYVSPQVDNGYDVANYTAIDPSYGTLADFDAWWRRRRRGIRIVLDMVLNHLDRARLVPSVAEWRVRTASSISGATANRTPLPNNWRSKFGGNAWQWHADSGQYYLHLFAIEQADLNWENPAVRAELKKVCEFWADRGVDGLRLDVVNLISKDQTFPCDRTGMAAASIPTARGCMNSCRR
jgi:trehalose-6-phosphate hydrolase